MATAFGLSQRLMTELRQELQSQVLQVHENTQHLAHELNRGLEAQEKHMHRTLQRLLGEGGLDLSRTAAGAGGKSMQEDDAVSLEEHLAGCRAAAAECTRCASKASQVTEALEDRFSELSQELLGEFQHLNAQEVGSRKSKQQLVRDEVQRGLERSERDFHDGEMKEHSGSGGITVVVDSCKAAASQCQRHAAEASAMAAEAETSSMTAERHLASCQALYTRYVEEATIQVDRRLESG